MKKCGLCSCCPANRHPLPGKDNHRRNNGTADFNNIHAAIDDANDGEAVIVARGTYSGKGNGDTALLGQCNRMGDDVEVLVR